MLTRSDNYDRALLAEIYDQTMTHAEDVALLRSLIGDAGSLDILECFSGTGRIMLPLLADGHNVTGIEIAQAMVDRSRNKAEPLGLAHKFNVWVRDALSEPWGEENYDVVVLGSNSLFELATVRAQKRCIELACQALRPSGHLFVDNNNWTSPLRESLGASWVALEGLGTDGTFARQTAETISVDESNGLTVTRRRWYLRTPAGEESWEEYDTSKRPVSGAEVRSWLTEFGFTIERVCGDFRGTAFDEQSERAIFWARKI
jgi:SAM-dependent methyltransferase